MISDARLFSVRSHEFRRSHLLVMGILVLAFSISMMVRFQGAEFGLELNEFDPYFNFRATEFLVENGLDEYNAWHDYRSWYPNGRDVSASSQVMLHFTAAATYNVFGGGMDLRTFIVIFPAVVGSLGAVMIFALVRTMAGTSAGLFAALLFAVSPAVIVRGTMGWFKSEPLGLFYGLLAVYLFLSGLRTGNRGIAAARLIGGGIVLSFGLSSWGGIQYFVIPIAIFVMALPFFRSDHKFLLWAVPLFWAAFLGTAALFEWPGEKFIVGLGGAAVVASTVLMAATIFVKSRSGKRAVRNSLVFLIGSFGGGMALIYANAALQIIPLPSFRYANALNPFLTTINPLTDSVAEHSIAGTAQSFWFLSVLMIFAGIGAWLLLSGKLNGTLKGRPEMIAFALITGMVGVYTSSAFIRLELFASISVIILSSIALSVISGMFFRPEGTELRYKKRQRNTIHALFTVAVVGLLIVPAAVPAESSWITGVGEPATIFTGGSTLGVVSGDWPHAFNWMRENTHEDAVIASWWDYGYWITTEGERISLADNWTSDHKRIASIAGMFLSSPDDAWLKLQELQADYVLIFIAAQGIDSEPPLYWLNGGGDEQKNYWFIRIAEEPLERYLHGDLSTETDYFWQSTVLGQMIPFTPRIYYNVETGEQGQSWQPGTVALLEKEIKMGPEQEGPLRLVYASPSFYTEGAPIIGVFIYEVNKEYVTGSGPETVAVPQNQISLTSIGTGLGDILVQLDSDGEPILAERFAEITNAGAFDGMSFHRIVPGVILQAGNPETDMVPPASGGALPPGVSAFERFGGIKYLVAAARGDALEGADPQFFIINSEVPWIAGDYTVIGGVISGEEVVDAIYALETGADGSPLDAEGSSIRNIRTNALTIP